MAYVPPHLRKTTKNEDPWLVQGKKKPKEIKKEKEKVDEFPALATPIVIQKSKMDFKELFTRRKEIKKRQHSIPTLLETEYYKEALLEELKRQGYKIQML